MAIDPWSVAANVGATASAVAVMGGMFWQTIKSQTKIIAAQAINDLGVVSKETYDKDRAEFKEELKQIRQVHHEFGILKNDMEHLKESNNRIEGKVDGLSGEITGAIMRVAQIQGKLEK